MVDALSRYPTTIVNNNETAKQEAQHPHVGFAKESVIILHRPKLLSTPLTSVLQTCDHR